MAAVTVSQTQGTNKAQVHSAGCIQNGRAICACDLPAARYISRTESNPGRPFYRCAKSNCSFWKWESDLLGAGLIPPQDPEPPKTPQQPSLKQHWNGTVAPTTPKKAPTALPLSPPRTQPSAKRNHARMSTGSGPRPGSSQKLSPEAKARQLAQIQAALNEMNDRNGGRTAETTSARTRANASDSGLDDEGEYIPSDDEASMPANKRTRFAEPIKVEDEQEETGTSHPQIPSTPPRRSTQAIQLPTPSQTIEREKTLEAEADDFFNSSAPPSPTSYTKRAQRALEREKAQNGAGGSGLLTNKGKARAVEGTEQSGNVKTEEPSEPHPILAPVASSSGAAQQTNHTHGRESEREAGHENESFAAQLALTIERASSDARTGKSHRRSGSHGNSESSSQAHTSASAAASLAALSAISAQHTILQTSLHDLIAESERWRRRAVSLEKSLTSRDRHIAKLQEEKANLKFRVTELESIVDQVQRFTQSSPRRKSN